MSDPLGVVDSARKLATQLSSELKRHHIENINFEQYSKQLQVISRKIQTLKCAKKQEWLIKTIFPCRSDSPSATKNSAIRFNSSKPHDSEGCKVQKTGKDTSELKKISLDSQPSCRDLSFKSQIKKEIAKLNSLENRIKKILQNCKQSKSDADTIEEAPECASPSGDHMGSPEQQENQRLLRILSCYEDWQASLDSTICSLQSIICKLQELKPKQQLLFSKAQFDAENSSPRKSVLTSILSKRSHKSDRSDVPLAEIKLNAPQTQFVFQRSRKLPREVKPKAVPGCAQECNLI